MISQSAINYEIILIVYCLTKTSSYICLDTKVTKKSSFSRRQTGLLIRSGLPSESVSRQVLDTFPR